MKYYMFSKILWLLLVLVIFLIMTNCRNNETKGQVNQLNNLTSDSLYSEYPDSISDELKIKLTDYDVPPEPIKNPMPDYPENLRKSGIQGIVLLEVEIDKNGMVTDAKVSKSLLSGENGLDEIAISTIKTWVFKPALLNNKPIAAKVNIPVQFTL